MYCDRFEANIMKNHLKQCMREQKLLTNIKITTIFQTADSNEHYLTMIHEVNQ